MYASYKEILQGQILWEGVTATFLQDAVDVPQLQLPILWEGVTTSELQDSIYRDEKCGMQLQTRFYRINLYVFLVTMLFLHT